MKDIRSKNQKMVHELKIDPKYFTNIELGIKTFEIRKDDRPFRANDILFLQGFNRKEEEYTGQTMFARVLSVFGRNESEKDFVKEGYVVLSIELIKSMYVPE